MRRQGGDTGSQITRHQKETTKGTSKAFQENNKIKNNEDGTLNCLRLSFDFTVSLPRHALVI